jgi:hypothetical protein
MKVQHNWHLPFPCPVPLPFRIAIPFKINRRWRHKHVQRDDAVFATREGDEERVRPLRRREMQYRQRYEARKLDECCAPMMDCQLTFMVLCMRLTIVCGKAGGRSKQSNASRSSLCWQCRGTSRHVRIVFTRKYL